MKVKLFSKLFIALAMNIVFWELFIRVFISSPCTQEADEQFGYMNISNAKFVYSTEGYSRDRFNSIGFNDDEPMWDVSARRIFVVGDSYSESFQVARRHSYIQRLEDGLNRQGTTVKTDVIKLARDGLNPALYPLLVDRFFDELEPDMIIVQFWAFSGGDLYSSTVSCKYDATGQITDLRVSQSAADKGKSSLRILINNSALLYHVLRRYKPLLMDLIGWISSIGAGNSGHYGKRGEKDQRSATDLEKRFTYILKKIQAHNQEMLVLYIPKPGVFFRPDVEPGSETFAALKAATSKNGIRFVDLTDSFSESYDRDVQPLNGFFNTLPGKGHVNTRGHGVIARHLYRVLTEKENENR
jgi:lysophospholipase L1-like esterase